MSPIDQILRVAVARRRAVRVVLKGAVFSLLFGLSSQPLGASETSLEYNVKAGYIFHFAQYIEWPESSLPAGAPIRIGLMAPPDVCSAIELVLNNKKVDGHELLMERLRPGVIPETPLHILFVQRSADVSPEDLARSLAKRPVLLVGETSGFAESGGMIGFVPVGDHLHFQINLVQASAAGLRVNSKLASYSMVEVVKPKE